MKYIIRRRAGFGLAAQSNTFYDGLTYLMRHMLHIGITRTLTGRLKNMGFSIGSSRCWQPVTAIVLVASV